jgi:serine/threonine protein kinase/WD40 repeat protein
MAVCPWCGTTIAKYFMDRNCPKCGKQLGDSKASSDATLATIEGSTFQDAIENFEKQQNEEILSTVEWLPPDITVDASDIAGAATVDQETLDQVVPFPSDDTAKSLPTEGTVDESINELPAKDASQDSEATLDAGFNTSTSADITLDAPSISTGLGSSSLGTEQTLDGESYGSASSIYKSAEVRKIWEKAAGANVDPAYSLSKGRVDVSDSVFEGISIRNLNVNASVVTFDADYQIRSELGRGKQGVVYAARQKGLGRTVAIKLVLKGAAGKIERDRLNRFVREAEITAGLDHPNILPIHELAITSEGELFYSMKKVDGRAWNEIISDTQMSLSENVECLLKVCDAIAFAHSKKVIHRDLKPGNIMIGGFGEVLVADWGMAVDLGKVENFRATRERKDPFSFGGTPAYMSPEMAKHDWPKIGTRSDIYLLGAILYHLVMGRPPRDGRTVYEVLERARANFYFPIENPTGLVAVALKAMEANPTDRYETVEEFQEAIREVNRHAESARLSDHAGKLLEQAQQTSDYSKFNESIFSFRNAIDLWTENKPAIAGLKQAKIAYSENALSRGDFDVCLETLDQNDAEEATLYAKAKQAQLEARSREIRYRRLRRVTSIGALLAVTILSGLSFWLWISIDQARVAQKQAQGSERIAINEAANAREQKVIADKEAEKARLAEGEAKKSEAKALDARDFANKTAAELSETNKKLAAETQQKEEERARAERKSIEALYNERIAKLGGFQSSLLSAFNLAESYNVRRSGALLSDIRDLQRSMVVASQEQGELGEESDQGGGLSQTPNLISWPYRRVASLIGWDLPKLSLGFNASCMDVASSAPLAVIGSAEGNKSQLQVLKLGDGKIERVAELQLSVDRSLQAVTISPDGAEVVFVCRGTAFAQPTVFYWNLGTRKVEPLVELKNREMQWAAFSPDGNHLLVGVNGGIYRWPRMQRMNFESVKPVIYPCKGTLGNIQFDTGEGVNRKAICNVVQEVPSKGTRRLTCYELDLSSDRFVSLEIPSEFSSQATAVAVVSQPDQLCLGTEDGRLLILSREVIGEANEIRLNLIGELFPRVHQTRIRHIRPLDQFTFLTVGQDNAVQIWRKQNESPSIAETQSATEAQHLADTRESTTTNWRHEVSLVGLPDSAVDGRFFGSGTHVLAMDQNGTCIDWDIAQQANRHRMEAPESASGIVAVGGVGEEGPNWWIDREGLLQIWGQQNGTSHEGIQYPGHTPNAEFVDMVLSTTSDRLVSVARLTERSNPFRASTAAMLEFCVWELSSGKMLYRWERASETAARVSLVSGGKQMIWVNETQAILCDLDGGNARVLKNGDQDIAAVEIAVHPSDGNVIALIGDKGEVWIVDLLSDARVIQFNRDWAFEVANVHLLKAAWNPAGNRLYLLRNTSEKNDMALVAIDWTERKLAQNVVLNDRLVGLQFPSRPDFKHVADLQVALADNGDEMVAVAVRYRFSDLSGKVFEAWSAKVQFSANGKSQIVGQPHDDKVWLTQDLQLRTQEQINEEFGNAAEDFWKVAFMANGSVAIVKDLRPGKFLPMIGKGVASESIRSFGRTSCMAADGDSLGKVWLTLHEEGELWEATGDSTGNVQWNRIPEKLVADVGFDRLHDVSVSPLGTTAILTGENAKSRSSVLIDLVTRKIIKRWEGIALSSWHPDGEQIALCTGDGELKVYRQGDERELELQCVAGAENDGDSKVKRISWFRENLMNKRESQNTTWYIVAQVGERKLQFCSLEVNRNASEFEPIVLDSAITSIASSPMDSSLAIGVASGNISTWFASPSVDRQPRELFSIDTHRGAVVSDVRFSRDGNALFSADAPESKALSVNRGRVYGWVSMRLENERLAPIAQN